MATPDHRDSCPVAPQNQQIAPDNQTPADKKSMADVLPWVNRRDPVLAYMLDREAICESLLGDDERKRRFEQERDARLVEDLKRIILERLDMDKQEWADKHTWEAVFLFSELSGMKEVSEYPEDLVSMIFGMCKAAYAIGYQQRQTETAKAEAEHTRSEVQGVEPGPRIRTLTYESSDWRKRSTKSPARFRTAPPNQMISRCCTPWSSQRSRYRITTALVLTSHHSRSMARAS